MVTGPMDRIHPSPDDVPLPDVIDAARVRLLYPHDPPAMGAEAHLAARLRRDLDKATAYAAALFAELVAVRDYLLYDIARDGGPPSNENSTDAASKLRTDADWDTWRRRYTAVASLIAGPAGDEGFAAGTAQAEHRAHRRSSTTE